MNAAAFRHFYDYHFGMNRFLWNSYITQLSEEQFVQPLDYSRGSVRDQIVHIMDADTAWFSGLRGDDFPEDLDPATFADQQAVREHWDGLEQMMRDYLAGLRDEMLFVRPWPEGEDKDLYLWQVLLHVVNHGTDHRAQILRSLHDLGVETTSQDYVFYIYERPFAPEES
jgi:uncharacterized damage-inducible protein DinB